MALAEKSIVVRVPVRTAQRWWTDWEHLPAFLDGLTKVTPRNAQTQQWDVEIAGHAQRWETRVEAGERRVAWRTTGTPHAEGDVELKPVEGGQTLVTLRLTYQPPGEHDVEGAAGVVDRLVMNLLERFKAFVEPREQRRLPDDDAPPPRGAETVDGPEGERGGPLDSDAGELPFDGGRERHHHSMLPAAEGFDALLEQVDDAEPTRPAPRPERHVDANRDDNEAQWSRSDS